MKNNRVDFSAAVENEMKLILPSLSVNEGMARAAVAAFCAPHFTFIVPYKQSPQKRWGIVCIFRFNACLNAPVSRISSKAKSTQRS